MHMLSAKVSHAYQAEPLMATLDYSAERGPEALSRSVANNPVVSAATAAPAASTASTNASESVSVTLGQPGLTLPLYSALGRLLNSTTALQDAQ